MTRYVLLRHDLPDGSWHVDWLLDPGGEGRDPDERRLIAFRTLERPDAASRAAFQAEQLPAHRVIYLDFEGDLPGTARGSVRRISRGSCLIHVREGERLAVTLHPQGLPPVSLEGLAEPRTPGAELIPWSFRVTPARGQDRSEGLERTSALNQ